MIRRTIKLKLQGPSDRVSTKRRTNRSLDYLSVCVCGGGRKVYERIKLVVGGIGKVDVCVFV